MRFDEFFDAHNKSHVEAYRHLYEKGVLPQSFCDEMDARNVEQHTGWQYSMASKMAVAWTEHVIKNGE